MTHICKYRYILAYLVITYLAAFPNSQSFEWMCQFSWNILHMWHVNIEQCWDYQLSIRRSTANYFPKFRYGHPVIIITLSIVTELSSTRQCCADMAVINTEFKNWNQFQSFFKRHVSDRQRQNRKISYLHYFELWKANLKTRCNNRCRPY